MGFADCSASLGSYAGLKGHPEVRGQQLRPLPAGPFRFSDPACGLPGPHHGEQFGLPFSYGLHYGQASQFVATVDGAFTMKELLPDNQAVYQRCKVDFFSFRVIDTITISIFQTGKRGSERMRNVSQVV